MSCCHVGTEPRWTCVMSSLGERKTKRPTTASSTCVLRSRKARMMLRRAASLMPMMLIATRKTITRMPPMESAGHVLRTGQKAAKYVGTKNAEMAMVMM